MSSLLSNTTTSPTITSEGVDIRKPASDVLSPTITSKSVDIRKTTSEGGKATRDIISTNFQTLSEQTLDRSLQQYKKLDSITVVSPKVIQPFPTLSPHLNNNIVKYNIPCPKSKPKKPVRVPTIHKNSHVQNLNIFHITMMLLQRLGSKRVSGTTNN